MSSHHFVKEDQEPAIIILESAALDNDSILDLFEWSPKILAWESAIDKLLTLKINIDQAFVSDIDYWEPTLLHQQPISIWHCSSEAEVIRTSLSKNINKDISAIHVVIEASQLSASIAATGSFFERIVFTYFDLNWKHIVVRSSLFEKWVSAGEEFLIRSLDKDLSLSTTGFMNNLNKSEALDFLHLQTKSEGFVRIEKHMGNSFIFSQRI